MLRLSPSRGRLRSLIALLVFGLAVSVSRAQDDPNKKPDEPKKQQDDPKKQQEETAKKAIEDFKNAIKDAKNVHEKALAIKMLGEVWPKDTSMVGPLQRYLAPGPGDINYLLPVATADALSKFRNNAHASQALIAALPMYKKIPYVHQKIVMAIGKVGHESALTIFEEPLKGPDPTPAIPAIEAISEMPAVIALESLFRKLEEIEKKREKASDAMKAFYDKIQPEILKAIKKVSEQPYPTLKELQIWWQRKGAAFKEKAAEKEKEAMAKKNGDGFKPGLPPPLMVEFLFKENAGTKTDNSGASSGMYATAMITDKKPNWSGNAPPNGGPSALDWGQVPGAYAVDLAGGPAGIEHLKNLKSFTISGWLNCRSEKEVPGDKMAGAGNRVLSWLNHGKDGVELVFRANGSLQLGINQWAEASSAVSKEAQITLHDEKATDQAAALRANWRFFAVTYDSTASAGHAKFYFGNANADAKLVSTLECPRGPVGPKIAPALTVGNTNVISRPMAPDRNFKGLIDEIRIHGSTADGSGALSLPEIVKVQNRVVPN